MFSYPPELFDLPVYGLPSTQKQAMLNRVMSQLSQHHYQHCEAYRRLLDSRPFNFTSAAHTEQFPVAARLFKDLALTSIQSSDVFRQMRSSGTSGQASKITLDGESAKRQSQVLVKILQSGLEWVNAKVRSLSASMPISPCLIQRSSGRLTPQILSLRRRTLPLRGWR